MNASTHRATIDRLRISQRWLWLGPVAGILCMVTLFVAGVATGSAPMVVIASTVAAVLGGVWASTYVVIRSELAKAERE